MKVSLKLDRWHSLVKQMRDVRPGLRGDEATFCDRFTAYMEKTLFNQMGTEPFAIEQNRDRWEVLYCFLKRNQIAAKAIYDQLIDQPPKPPVEPQVDAEELDECRKMLAMDDDEFERATKPQPEPETKGQPTLF